MLASISGWIHPSGRIYLARYPARYIWLDTEGGIFDPTVTHLKKEDRPEPDRPDRPEPDRTDPNRTDWTDWNRTGQTGPE